MGSVPIRRRGAGRPRGTLLVVAVVCALVAWGGVGGAQGPVTSDGARARVWGLRLGGGFDLAAEVTSDAGYWSCSTATFSIDDALIDAPALGALPPDVTFLVAPPGAVVLGRYWVTCISADGGRFDEIGWVVDVVDVDAEVWWFAAWYLAEVGPPPFSIGFSPPGRAVVGTETWFWFDGYRGGPFVSRHDVVGYPVDVRFDLAGVDWSYGDGTAARLGPQGVGVVDGPGAPWHRYAVRSTGVAPDAAFTVVATARFDVSYTFAGRGPFRVEPSIGASAARDVVVREAQALLGRRSVG